MKVRHIAFVLTLAFGSMAAAQTAVPTQNTPDQQTQGKWKGHRGEKGNKLAKQLGLSADQQSQLKTIHQDERTQAEAIKNNSSLTPDQKRDQLKQLRQADQQKMESILTPDQRTKFQQIREERKEHRGKRRRHGRGRGQGRGQGTGAPANPSGPGF